VDGRPSAEDFFRSEPAFHLYPGPVSWADNQWG
jgi:hypothetical protein